MPSPEKVVVSAVVGIISICLLLLVWAVVFSSYADWSQKFVPKAVAQNKPTLCEKVFAPLSIGGATTNNLRADCRQQVAIANRNPKACLGDDCFEKVAKVMNQIAICDFIKDEYDKGFCYGLFAIQEKNDSMCKTLVDSKFAKYPCYISFARYNKIDGAFCENNLKDTYYESECFGLAATDTKNEALCQKKKDEYSPIKSINDCIESVRYGIERTLK